MVDRFIYVLGLPMQATCNSSDARPLYENISFIISQIVKGMFIFDL